MGMNDEEFDRQYAAATKRGEERLRRDPRAVAVRYDRRTRKVVVDLDNGCTLLVPPDRAEGLAGASPMDLAAVHVLGPGTSIAWPRLDVQFSVTGLLAGTFGTRVWMARLRRAAVRTKSHARSRGVRRTRAAS
jgi:hypothetical protein